MPRPTIYADFHNADPRGRLRLNCTGTLRDLAEKGITLTEGLPLTLSDDDLEADGEAHFAEEERLGWPPSIGTRCVRGAPVPTPPRDRDPFPQPTALG